MSLSVLHTSSVGGGVMVGVGVSVGSGVRVGRGVRVWVRVAVGRGEVGAKVAVGVHVGGRVSWGVPFGVAVTMINCGSAGGVLAKKITVNIPAATPLRARKTNVSVLSNCAARTGSPMNSPQSTRRSLR